MCIDNSSRAGPGRAHLDALPLAPHLSAVRQQNARVGGPTRAKSCSSRGPLREAWGTHSGPNLCRQAVQMLRHIRGERHQGKHPATRSVELRHECANAARRASTEMAETTVATRKTIIESRELMGHADAILARR
jgi:hypothetical protein